MARRSVDDPLPPPAGQFGDLNAPLFLDAGSPAGGIDPELWYYYLAGQFETAAMTPPFEPDLGPDSEVPEVPIGEMTPPFPARPPSELQPQPPVGGGMTPPYPNDEELNPSVPPGAPALPAPELLPPQAPPPSESPPPPTPRSPLPQTLAGAGSAILPVGVAIAAVEPLPVPAPPSGPVVAQVDAASEAASREFEAIVQRQRIAPQPSEFEKIIMRKPPPPLSDFEKIIMRKDLERSIGGGVKRRVLSRAPMVWPIVGEVLGGELGMILPTIFFPDEARREQEAASEAAVQKAIAQANRKAIIPPWNAAPSVTPSRAPRASRSGPPAPPAPPSVPHLPGLSPEQLSKVLGEPSASTLPDVVGPEAARREVSAAARLPVRQRRRATPTRKTAGSGWNYPLGVATATRHGFKAGEREGRRPLSAIAFAQPLPNLPGAGASVDTPGTTLAAPLPNPRVAGLLPALGPPLPGVSTDAPTLAAPLPLTATNDAVLQPPRDQCRCERPTPRPSNKVPTVKSYKRRMSQNSLDNLRRG